mmetsp:Transcript_23293/g.31129  ORF Transcript_23293/g.31129 Transcript_23293/m.31129 type:complete len:142 (+) Transcript_23293:81-506(+)
MQNVVPATKQADELRKQARRIDKKLTALLKKFVTFMVCSQLFWVLEWIPFIPAAPVQLAVAIWILIPQNEGEKVIYLMLQGYFTKFEEKMTAFRYVYLSLVLKGMLKSALFFAEYCSKRVAPDSLPDFQLISAQIDQALLR